MSASLSRTLLALGALAGAALAAYGIVAPGAAPKLPADAIALVNGVAISRADFERARAGVAADRREPLGAGEQRQVLDRLIDEELMLQRAVAMGLYRSDLRTRGALVSALIAAAEADGDEAPASDAELRAHYEAHHTRFERTGRVQVRQIYFAAGSDAEHALVRARAARARLDSGASFDEVQKDGDAPRTPLPDQPVPAQKLIDYLGPTAVKTALALEKGRVSEPVRSASGYHLLLVVEKEVTFLPPFEQAKDGVADDLRREADDRRVRRYTSELRSEANVVMGEVGR